MAGTAGAPDAFWVGGSPCAGKSTIADLLGARHGIPVVHCDDGALPRWRRVRAQASPVLTELTELSDCERWTRPPAWQAEKELLYYREQFPLLLAELAAVEAPFIVEGADLLPELVVEQGVPLSRGVWVVASPQFQLEQYARRDWARTLVAPCADPVAAFHGWMERDILFASAVAESALRLGGTVVVVDGSRSVAAVAAEVATHLGLATAAGQPARTTNGL